MKSLCCRKTFVDQSSLKNHYLEQHNVDENNQFFKRIFSRDKALSQGNVFNVIISGWTAGMKKHIIFFYNTVKVVDDQLR